jgi:hypothetical protein
MSSVVMREGWEFYADFVHRDQGARMSFCAVECYAWGKVRDRGGAGDAEGVFPWWKGADFRV